MKDESAFARIMSEQADWLRLSAQDADTRLDVYIDLKSPHAYLAVRPTLEIARDFHVSVNFLPYTLSYETLGVSKSVDADMQRRPVSPAADRKARMYYATAREYAALQSLPLKSPHRLLDSTAAHRALLFAKQQKREVPFAMAVYLAGWSSGWRDIELESAPQLKAISKSVDVDTDGYDAFVAPGGAADAALRQLAEDAEAAGLVGTPHFVFDDPAKGRRLGLFGREHLALIRGKFIAAGLARSADVTANFSHAWTGPDSNER